MELNNIPEQIKELLASAGVLNSVPWDASAPSNGESNAYFQTPEDSQSYDWDLSMDTLDDVIEVEQPTSDGSQVSCSKLYCMPQRQLLRLQDIAKVFCTVASCCRGHGSATQQHLCSLSELLVSIF